MEYATKDDSMRQETSRSTRNTSRSSRKQSRSMKNGNSSRGFPKRPSSPHLALGHEEKPVTPKFSDDISYQEQKAIMKKHKKDLANYLKTRVDQLERLIVRKLKAKQSLHQTEHVLTNCHICTSGAYAQDGVNWKPYPGAFDTKIHKHKYLYEANSYKHVQDPNPRRPRVVLGPSARASGACKALERGSTWRLVDDLAGAGRLPKKYGMSLPNQRSTGQTELYRSAIKFFAYFDANDSGNLSYEELGVALRKTLHVELEDEVVRELFERFDVDGQGNLNFHEIALRLLEVAEVKEGVPLPANEKTCDVVKAWGNGSDAQARLEDRVNRLEREWVARISQKSRYITPSAYKECFETMLLPFAMSRTNRALDAQKLVILHTPTTLVHQTRTAPSTYLICSRCF